MTSGSFLASLRCMTRSLPGKSPAAYNRHRVTTMWERYMKNEQTICLDTLKYIAFGQLLVFIYLIIILCV